MIPSESEILPSLDDSDDNFSDDLDDDEDLDDQDEMMADEPLETLEEEDEDDDYESEEDTPVIDQDFMNDGESLNCSCAACNSRLRIFPDVIPSTSAPSTTSTTTTIDAASQTTQAPEKPSEIPISPPSNDAVGTSIPTPDPYFTHFDPRMEHQSYKVGLDVKKLLNIFTLID